MARKETGFLKALYNSFTGTGVTVRRRRDFWGNVRTEVRNYDTGITKEYTHRKGFFSDNTDVRVTRNNKEVGRGRIRNSSFIIDRTTHEYTGECYACKGTGIHRSGNPCRRCNGTGVYHRTYHR